MPVRDRPITIVGAGPAGLTCAILLARRGRRVVVREARSQVGLRFHDDFQGIENWSCEEDALAELAASGIRLQCELVPVREGHVFDPDGRLHHITAARPLYYLVRRGSAPGSLDRDLLAQALEAGAEVRFGDRVHRVEGPAILATGPRRADAIAVGYVFDTDMPDGDWLALSDDLAALGYAYLLVHRGHGTLATCLFTDFKREQLYLRRTVAFFRTHAGLRMHNARRFGGYANFRLPRRALQGGRPVVGEQAGFQDALAGFGLRYAFRSAILAVRSELEGDSYPAAWRRELLPLMRTGVVNRFLFNSLGEAGRRRAVDRLVAGDTARVLRRFYRPSLWSRTLFPLARMVYRRPLRDPSCDHQDCECVWCGCGIRQKNDSGRQFSAMSEGRNRLSPTKGPRK